MSSQPAPSPEKMGEHVVALTAQLNIYIPMMHLKSSSLVSLFGTSVSAATCRITAEKIKGSISAYSSALERFQRALNLAIPVGDLPDFDSEAAGTSDLVAAFADFRKTYAPTVFGCTGHHSDCKGQATPSTCRKAGGDCAWALIQQHSGRCKGVDSRCSKAPFEHWKEGCDLLKAQKASCSWEAKGSYVSDTARLTDMLATMGAVRPFDFQSVPSTDFEKRFSAIERSFGVVEQSFLALKRALGMDV